MSGLRAAGFTSAGEARAAGYIPGEEAAQIAGIGRNHLQDLSRRGEAPPPVRVGHAYWWLKTQLQAWTKTRTRPRRRNPGKPAPKCSARGCDRQARAKSLCLKHYKRRWRGRPPDEERPLGEPIGAGQWGILDENDDGLLCHECGQRFQSLGPHTHQAHGISAAEYREAYGLPRSTRLATKRLRSRQSEYTRTKGLATYLEHSRDPQAAADARTADTFDAVSRTRRQHPLGTASTNPHPKTGRNT